MRPVSTICVDHLDAGHSNIVTFIDHATTMMQLKGYTVTLQQ